MCRTNLKTKLKYNYICVANQTIEIASNRNGDKLILFNVTRAFVNNVLPGISLAIKSCLRDRSSLCWVKIREKINRQNQILLEFTSKGNDELHITKIEIVNSALADTLPQTRVRKNTDLSRDSSEDATPIFKCPRTYKYGKKTICIGGVTSTEKRPRDCPKIKNMNTICLGAIYGEKRMKRNAALKLSVLKVSLRLSVLNSNKLKAKKVLDYMSSKLSIL